MECYAKPNWNKWINKKNKQRVRPKLAR
jgi:hypothetical protein